MDRGTSGARCGGGDAAWGSRTFGHAEWVDGLFHLAGAGLIEHGERETLMDTDPWEISLMEDAAGPGLFLVPSSCRIEEAFRQAEARSPVCFHDWESQHDGLLMNRAFRPSPSGGKFLRREPIGQASFPQVQVSPPHSLPSRGRRGSVGATASQCYNRMLLIGEPR